MRETRIYFYSLQRKPINIKKKIINKGRESKEHNTINIWERHNSKPHYLFCINLENQDEITMLFLSKTIPTLSKFNLQLISKLKTKA